MGQAQMETLSEEFTLPVFHRNLEQLTSKEDEKGG